MKPLKTPHKILIGFLLAAGIWFGFNRPGRVGLHFYGFTVYSGLPIPNSDLLVHGDGSFVLREDKSHDLPIFEFEQFVNTGKRRPDIVVIGKGYKNQLKVPRIIMESQTPEVEALNSKEAVRRFNELRGQRKKVALILHSTC